MQDLREQQYSDKTLGETGLAEHYIMSGRRAQREAILKNAEAQRDREESKVMHEKAMHEVTPTPLSRIFPFIQYHHPFDVQSL